MKTIAFRLKLARESHKNWTQGQLAVVAGVSQSTIGNIEAGIREGRGSLPKIAKALGVSHDWLADGEGEMLPIANGGESLTAKDQAQAIDALDVEMEIPTEVDHPSTYGDRLRQAMVAAQKELKDVSGAIGITVLDLKSILDNKKGNRIFLSARANALVAKYLQVDSNWLVLGDGPMRNQAANETPSNLSHDAIDIAIEFDRLTNKSDRALAYNSAIGIFTKILSDRNLIENSKAPAEEANSSLVQADLAEKSHA